MKVRPERLREIAYSILKGLVASDEEAALVAESLVRAEMRGIDTHGVYFLKLLSERVEAGMIRLPTKLEVIKDQDAIALIDGGNGLGQIAAHQAMSMNIQKAKRFGIGLTLIRNTNNIGVLAFYSLLAAEKGMVGMIMCNGAPSMAPWGGIEPYFGTDPISIAIPGGSEGSIVLDMSSSVVARGKIRLAERMKEKIPLGWALDEAGVPTTDPKAALKGTIVPVGGPKGYCLALVIDVLAGVLSGSSCAPNVETFHQLLGPTGVGVFSLAVDIERFMPLDQFKSLMQSYSTSVKRTKKIEGVSCIYLPGETESEKEKESLIEGIEVNPMTVEILNQLLKKVDSQLKLTGDE